jgi:hypothetical protein
MTNLLYGVSFILVMLAMISHVPFHKMRRSKGKYDDNDLFV